MLVYRIANVNYKDAKLLGIGAEKLGGRIDAVGTRAAIVLKMYSYPCWAIMCNLKIVPICQKLLAKIYFPDEFIIQEWIDLPKKWNQYPYNSNTTEVFTQLAKNRDFFALRVPSTIVGLETNSILNPLYKEFGKVEVREFIKMPIDESLKKYVQK
jgi:hypothetical protein